ncbi:uncharacterized protein LOC143449215 [Clavelina lepadiformis]|uniref:uncharacterized protein LOC143449215 n=1 Tax=Clavelina lepadiformis TaxID=159417 RepID=UPI004041DDEE
METNLIQNQVDGNGATMTIRHLFLQEIKSVRLNVEKEFVKLEEKIEELISKHFLEETDRAEVVSNTLSYEQASGSPSIQSDVGVWDQEAYSKNSSIFAHFEKIKEEFLLDEEQSSQRFYFKKSEIFPKHVAENLSENFENNCYTSLSRSGVSDVSSNASRIDNYSLNNGFLSDQESKSFENKTNKEPCAISALENFQQPINQKGLTGKCFRETVTKVGCMNKACLQKPLHLSSKTARGQYTCEICGKEFGKRFNLNRHKRCLHPDEIDTIKCQHTCEICGKQFAKKFNLDRHKLFHTGEKPSPVEDSRTCEFCGKQFAKRFNLNRHKLFHTNEMSRTLEIV